MAERIKFPGDPEIKETGSGQAPQIPLNPTVAPTSVEMLDKDGKEKPSENVDFHRRPSSKNAPIEDDDDDDDDIDDVGPNYARERIGSRIGEPLEATQNVIQVEKTLDEEDVVPLLFPTKVSVQDKGLMHHFEPGVHLVPVSLAGLTKKDMHWYLKANGVKRTQRDPIPNPKRVDEDA